MRPALCTVLTDDYLPGFHALVKSLQYHNKNFDYLFYILCDEDLTKQAREKISLIYDNVCFIPFKSKNFYDLFISVNGSIKPKFYKCLYTLDVFDIKHDGNIIFLDSDMLCLGSIEEIIELPETLGFSYATDASVVSDMNNIFKDKTEFKKKSKKTRFNAGLFVIPPDNNYLSKIHTWMIKHRGKRFNLPEQKIMNMFFSGHECYHISREYNALKRFFHDGWFDESVLNKCKIIHYVGQKPWNWSKEQGYSKINKIWTDFYNSECK